MNKNIRAKIKTSMKQTHSEGNLSNGEISFNLTPDEDEDSERIRLEARELINKSEKIMQTKFKSPVVSERAPSFAQEIFCEEKPADLSVKREEFNQNNTQNKNTSLLNQKLLEKIKIIKTLEKDVKDKNAMINGLYNKIDKQADEIKKLNEKLNAERNSNLKNEILLVNKKMREKEEEHCTKSKIFENLISEYKNKIEGLIHANETISNKNKEIEIKLKHSLIRENEIKSENEKYSKQIVVLKNQIKEVNDNCENEIEKKIVFEEKVGVLIRMIKNIKFENVEKDLYIKLDKLFTN